MEEQVMNLSVHPQILDLYTVLEQNGLSKQKEEIQSLVSYIENMENKGNRKYAQGTRTNE